MFILIHLILSSYVSVFYKDGDTISFSHKENRHINQMKDNDEESDESKKGKRGDKNADEEGMRDIFGLMIGSRTLDSMIGSKTLDSVSSSRGSKRAWETGFDTWDNIGGGGERVIGGKILFCDDDDDDEDDGGDTRIGEKKDVGKMLTTEDENVNEEQDEEEEDGWDDDLYNYDNDLKFDSDDQCVFSDGEGEEEGEGNGEIETDEERAGEGDTRGVYDGDVITNYDCVISVDMKRHDRNDENKKNNNNNDNNDTNNKHTYDHKNASFYFRESESYQMKNEENLYDFSKLFNGKNNVNLNLKNKENHHHTRNSKISHNNGLMVANDQKQEAKRTKTYSNDLNEEFNNELDKLKQFINFQGGKVTTKILKNYNENNPEFLRILNYKFISKVKLDFSRLFRINVGWGIFVEPPVVQDGCEISPLLFSTIEI